MPAARRGPAESAWVAVGRWRRRGGSAGGAWAHGRAGGCFVLGAAAAAGGEDGREGEEGGGGGGGDGPGEGGDPAALDRAVVGHAGDGATIIGNSVDVRERQAAEVNAVGV